MAIKKVDLRNREYKRCDCCNLILHQTQFWNKDQPCGACQRETCTTKECRLGVLHDR